ncbi:MAG: stage III sporulation protein AG [Caldicoprobacterales bacterium]
MKKDIAFKKFFDKLKKINNIEYFIFILAIAIIVGLFGNWFHPKQKIQETSSVANNNTDSSFDTLNDDKVNPEYRLKEVLSSIKGAGKVEVMITYRAGTELVPAMNIVESNIETEEHDSNGGIRKVVQSEINTQPVSLTTSEGNQPLITKEIQPEVLGVIIVAEGAEDIKVRMELQKAVQTLLGIKSSQVEIFIMKEGE